MNTLPATKIGDSAANATLPVQPRKRGRRSIFGVLIPLSIAVGPAFSVHSGGKTAPVYWCEIVAVLAFLSTAPRSAQRFPELLFVPLPIIALLFVRAAFNWNYSLGLETAWHLTCGMTGGTALALCLEDEGTTFWTSVDSGVMIFGLVGVSQLAIAIRHSTLANFHKASQLPWGDSNYVGIVLVLAALWILGRAKFARHTTWTRIAAVIIGLGALATLSRGALVALSAGLVGLVSVRNSSHERSRHRSRSSRVLLAAGLTTLAGYALYYLWNVRELTSAATQNVLTRGELWRLAWQAFIQHPVAGTGFQALRTASFQNLGEQESYAHNLILSLLQQAGLLAIPFLLYFGSLAWRGRRGFLASGTVAVAVATAVVLTEEVVIEGSQAGILVWLVVATGAVTWMAQRRLRPAVVRGAVEARARSSSEGRASAGDLGNVSPYSVST